MREKEAMFFVVRGRIFFANDNFQGTFVVFRLMMFTKILIKESALILIHVRKIFNCRVSFKMLLLMYFGIVEKKLQHSCVQETSGLAFPKKIPKQWQKLFSSKYHFLTLLRNKRNECTEYHGTSIPFKSQFYSKYGSPTFLLFRPWNLVLYLSV